MSDYITRSAAVAVLHYNCDEKCSSVVCDMESIPSEDVVPVVHGKWVYDHTDMASGNFAIVRCSVCGYQAYAIAEYVKQGNFCPNCGAKMDAE